MDIGDYYVIVSPPAGYGISPQDVGADNLVDSDIDPTTGSTVTTNLAPGENDPSWDAGIYQLPTPSPTPIPPTPIPQVDPATPIPTAEPTPTGFPPVLPPTGGAPPQSDNALIEGLKITALIVSGLGAIAGLRLLARRARQAQR